MKNYSNNVNTGNRNHLFTSLPRSIGGHILSFCSMRDRLQHEVISRDFYEFSRDASSRFHLVIDHEFCKALYYDKIRMNKHFNAGYLDIKYVFKDGKFEKFEDKYYSSIAKLISKSPSLYVLKYDLTHNKIHSKLSGRYIRKDDDQGHLLQWMHNVMMRNEDSENTFAMITKLVWNPTQFGYFNGMRRCYTKFRQWLPNVTYFISNRPRFYAMISRHDYTDCFWEIIKKPDYHHKLQHLEIDLCIPERFVHSRGDNIKHIHIDNHPLSYIHKFENLRSLKLTLPLFLNCGLYYHRYLNYMDFKSLNNDNKCLHLTELCIVFNIIKNSQFTADAMDSISDTPCFDDVIDGVCKYILSKCSNLMHYTLLINRKTEKMLTNKYYYHHLMGFYGKLQSFVTNTAKVFHSGIRMISLKRLRIVVDANNSIENQYKELNVKGFINLRSFECEYMGYGLIFNLEYFMDYVAKLKHNDLLTHVAVYHTTREHLMFGCTKEWSLSICGAIIKLLTENKIESIFINQIPFKQTDLEYLYFWFNNEYGKFKVNEVTRKKHKIMFISDMYCCNAT